MITYEEDGSSARPAKRQRREQQQHQHHHERDGGDGSQKRNEGRARPDARPDAGPRPHSHQHRNGHGSERRHHRRHHEREASRPSPTPPVSAPALLPFNAQPLSTRTKDYTRHVSLFASYLDVQKNLMWDALDEREKKGRWKSFVKRWNEGQLAAGWYEPGRLRLCQAEWQEREFTGEGKAGSDVVRGRAVQERAMGQGRAEGHDGTEVPVGRHDERPKTESESRRRSKANDGTAPGSSPRSTSDVSSDESVGPALPSRDNKTNSNNHNHNHKHNHTRKQPQPGPSIPTLDDLALQREASLEAKQADYAALHAARRVDAQLQRTRLDELVPRAEPGTRARQLEKKAEVNATMKAFRERSPGAGMEIDEGTLMGGGGDSVGELKQLKREEERKKSEREVRRDEVRRAREVEREERLRGWREKEAGTMEMLKGLARERFG